MLGKQEKRRRFQASPYALYGAHIPPAGLWRAQLGKPEAPLLVELGCGKGDFAVGAALACPEMLVIGIDRKADRLWHGVRLAAMHNLKNVFFCQADALVLEHLFAPAEVSELWLTYPDPYPRARQAKHRLTHPRFLRQYARILRPGHLLHLKTDSELLWTYSQTELTLMGAQICATVVLGVEGAPLSSLAWISTDFERKKRGPVFYLAACWP